MKRKAMFIEAMEQEQQQIEEQTKLKEKHNIEEENVIVVEKSNMVKFTIRLVIRAIKFIFTLILLFLAMVGMIALIYPIPRADLKDIFLQMFTQLSSFF